MSQLDLKQMLIPDRIELDTEVADWEEAIRRAGQLLVETKAVKESFVDAMINVANELGPYIVVAPGIALPHARPEDGVLTGGMAMVRLSKPVKFGHRTNDPVDLVVALAPIDNSSHTVALSQLAEFLGNADNVKKIREAKTATDVAALLEQN